MKKVIEKLNFILKLVESNLSNTKIIELVYKECVDTIKEVEELQNRKCENCKHYKQSSSQDYKSCYEIKINGFNFESEKDFYCKNWELKNEKI